MQRDRVRAQSRRGAPRSEAGEHHRRHARRNACGRLGPRKIGGPFRDRPASAERTLVPPSSSGSAETLPGSAMGTPAFMSPEQAAATLIAWARHPTCTAWRDALCVLTGPGFAGDDNGAVPEAVRRGRFPPPEE